MLTDEHKRENSLMLNIGCIDGKQRGGGRVGGMQEKVGRGVWKI